MFTLKSFIFRANIEYNWCTECCFFPTHYSGLFGIWFWVFFQLKEKAANSTELQHQLEKAKQQHQEQQTLQQNTTAKLREAQVMQLCFRV